MTGALIAAGVVAVLGLLTVWALRTAPTCHCPPEDDCGGGCIKRRG
jgi:hypothetical protein